MVYVWCMYCIYLCTYSKDTVMNTFAIRSCFISPLTLPFYAFVDEQKLLYEGEISRETLQRPVMLKLYIDNIVMMIRFIVQSLVIVLS